MTAFSRRLVEANAYLIDSDVAVLRLMKEHASAESAKAALRDIKAGAARDRRKGEAAARVVGLRRALEAMR